jgi:lipid-A-disaccharide synthase
MQLLKPFLRANSIVLANLIAGENAIPEYLDGAARPEVLARAIATLLSDTPERRRQLAAFAEIGRRMRLAEGTPSRKAADIVLGTIRTDRWER